MAENKTRIYLDNAATTPVDPEVFETMKPYFAEKFGNPSSVHQFGQEAAAAVVGARQQAADFLNCQASEIIFTSGATEGNNTVIKGIGRSKKLAQKLGGKPHIIVSSIEHECVSAAAQSLLDEGLAEITFLPVNEEGIVELDELEKAVKGNTVLVSIMYANNEVGTVQPIGQIGELLKNLNAGRRNKIFFHTDAVQGINYLECDVQKLGVDFLSLSAHKFYGPKGAGALFVRRGAFFEKYMHGGEQEFKLRSGTHNTPGIVGLGAAISKVKAQTQKNQEILRLRNKLIDGVLGSISGSALNGSRQHRLPNNANFRFDGVEGESVLVSLDFEGMAVSTGSACASKSLEPSHVLTSMGLTHIQAHSSIRFSLGRQNTEQEIDRVLAVLPSIIKKIRSISGTIKEEEFVRKSLPKDFGC